MSYAKNRVYRASFETDTTVSYPQYSQWGSTRLSSFPSPLPKWWVHLYSHSLNRTLTLTDDELMYKTVRDIHTVISAVQEQLGKCHNGVKIQGQKSIRERHKPCAPSAAKHQDRRGQKSLSMGKSQNALDPLRQNVDIQHAGLINKVKLQAMTRTAKSNVCKRFRLTPSVPAVSERYSASICSEFLYLSRWYLVKGEQ